MKQAVKFACEILRKEQAIGKSKSDKLKRDYPNLRECPFCGYNKLKIDRKRKRAGYTGLDDIVYYDTYSVRCPKCFGRGGAVSGRVLSRIRYDGELPEWTTTGEELRARAAEAWNRRAGNVK